MNDDGVIEPEEREGQEARTRGVVSGMNPHLAVGRSDGADPAAQQARFRKCNAWWRGWDREDARRRGAPLHSVNDDGPQKSALLRVLADSEPELRNLRGATSGAQSGRAQR